MLDLTHLIGTRVPRLMAKRFPDLLWRVNTRQRTLYLTFDDGPTGALTHRILDLLARYEAKASFFLLGHQADRDPGLVRALQDGGHTVGNHTYSHPDAWRAPRALVLGELDRTTKLLEDQVQTSIRWMRPPYGRFTHAMRSWCLARRQRLTMWDIMPGDYLSFASVQKIDRRIRSWVRPGSIIVLHDNPKARAVTPAALATLLPDLRADGWRFEAL